VRLLSPPLSKGYFYIVTENRFDTAATDWNKENLVLNWQRQFPAELPFSFVQYANNMADIPENGKLFQILEELK
jgi:hypothetical protein